MVGTTLNPYLPRPATQQAEDVLAAMHVVVLTAMGQRGDAAICRDLNVADGNGTLLVELVFKRCTVVGGLQQTARSRCRPPDTRIFLVDR